jgi:hypothetical protein
VQHTETVGRPNKEKSLSPNDNNLKAEPKHNTRAVIADAAKAGNQNAAKESLNIEDKTK